MTSKHARWVASLAIVTSLTASPSVLTKRRSAS